VIYLREPVSGNGRTQHYSDYFREQAVKYRELVEKAQEAHMAAASG
jgi:hypothetical protein